MRLCKFPAVRLNISLARQQPLIVYKTSYLIRRLDISAMTLENLQHRNSGLMGKISSPMLHRTAASTAASEGPFSPSLSMRKALTSRTPEDELTKDLTESLKTVAQRVSSVRKSFRKIEKLVSESSKTVPAISKLVSEWGEISQEYDTIIKESRDVACEGAEVIHDFLKYMVPFLTNDNESLSDRQAEIKSYLETMKDGRGQARRISDALRAVSNRVEDFKAQWAKCTEGALNDIANRLSALQDEIDEMMKSESAIKREMLQTAAPDVQGIAQAMLILLPPKYAKSMTMLFEEQRSHEMKKNFENLADIDGKKREQQAERKHLSDLSENQVSVRREAETHMDNICKKMECLTAIWNLIHTDIHVIGERLKFIANGKSAKLYSTRMAELPGLYEALGNALRKYATALPGDPEARQSKRARFKRFVRSFRH
ncbi:hypothetical protein SCHPADRAFT_904158 [Schizopora paradoxa]|uniref:Uncharacterized protein n=1 Tax=Schizopora paradoxa TaxID=27342 RepID=A0A0H2RNC4_9AGAM|nr:hypothetical protein SCHPADRAFT_904158 [Schizopora paradoxa]